MQDNAIYGFGAEDARQLKRVAGTFEGLGATESNAGGMVPNYMGHAVAPSGGIPARSSLTMGSASCTLYSCNSSGVLSSTSSTETIYNMSTTAVAANAHIVYAMNMAGLRVVIVESCS